MRVGLCGSHRTGKTTLAETISYRTGIPFLRTTTSAVFKECGIDPSKPMDFKTRLWIQLKILEASENVWSVTPKQFITDRTPLDMAAYTLADIQGATDVDFAELWKYLIRCFEVTNRYFKVIVLIQPGIPLVHEKGKAALNEGYLEHLNYLMLGLCNDDRLQCRFICMPRSVIRIDDRVDAVLNVIAGDSTTELQKSMD